MAALTQTTLSAAITANQTTFAVASSTNLSNPVNGMRQKIYVMDPNCYRGELMTVDNVPASGVVTVSRLDEFRTPHASGSLVLIANVDPTISTFYTHNPSGYAVADPGYTTPWVNVTTGEQWLFSSIQNIWVPGFGNPACKGVTAAHASGTAAMVVSGPLFHVTGTSAVTSIVRAIGYNGGEICVINDGAWTWTTGDGGVTSITAASVGGQVAGTMTRFAYDFAASKWVADGRA